MEDEEFISAATQTDPITSSDDDDDDDDENIEELQLTMDTVGDLNGIDYHLEYEEITLKRSKNGKRLGLTLCYGNNDEYDTDIFVSEIEKGSIADIDGRIKVGDQILQVNRLTVNSRKEAITQFSMDKNEITILLSRPRLVGLKFKHVFEKYFAFFIFKP
uniref:PDZ domain-containing protein n=1 Tax=Panagrolaimus sp. PS1159 TaxID=55785 RepID=A0AC35GWR8_9BILA